jgi:hypothetical protein
MSENDLQVMDLVENLVTEYAGRVPATRIINTVYDARKAHPDDLFAATRDVLDVVDRVAREPLAPGSR